MTGRRVLLGALLATGISSPAIAGKHHITGQILDRNGQPVPRAVVSLVPGNVSLVTDREGRFSISYLREDNGKRTRLAKKRDYDLEVLKVGFHDHAEAITYKRGVLEVESIQLKEESLRVTDDLANLAQSHGNPTGSGHTVEGE